MIILVAEFYLPNYVLLRQMSKMSFHFQIRHWWDSKMGVEGLISETHSTGAGWNICDLIMSFGKSNDMPQRHTEYYLWINPMDWRKMDIFTQKPEIRVAGGYTTMCWALPLPQALCWASHIHLISLRAIIVYYSQNKSMYRTRCRGLLISKLAFKPGPSDVNIL